MHLVRVRVRVRVSVRVRVRGRGRVRVRDVRCTSPPRVAGARADGTRFVGLGL